MIAYLKAGLVALEAAGVVSKILLALGAGAALLATYGVWHHKVYRQGVDDAIAGIAREDAKYLGRAIDARKAWRDRCRAEGRELDQTTGRCQ